MKLEDLSKEQLITEYKKVTKTLLEFISSSLDALDVEEEPNVSVGVLNG